MTTEVQTKKQSNRAIQRTHATYKKKSEISEALNEIRQYVNVSTYKFLSHFLHTDGTGVTQIKISEWCKKVGISLGSYHKTVKPEIENMFKQALIIKVKAPMKYDAKRKKKVQASEFKSLLPLSVIKHLIKQKEQEERMENENFFNEKCIPSEIESEIEGEIEGEIESEIESDGEIPCESKDESTFLPQQNNSFREKHLENNIKIKNNNRFKETDCSSNQPKKYNLKKVVREILNQFVGLHDEQKQEMGERIQILCKKKHFNLNNDQVIDAITDATNTFIEHYEKNRQNLNSDYYGAYYRTVENRLYDLFVTVEPDFTDDYEDDIDLDESEMKHGVDGYYYPVNMQRAEIKASHEEYLRVRAETCATKEELNELQVY